MKWLALVLCLLLLFLQYRLWFPEGSKAELARLHHEVVLQQRRNAELNVRNRELELEVLELQAGLEGLEARARETLGLIKEGETYYQIVEQQGSDQ